jgi:hypothetical protein
MSNRKWESYEEVAAYLLNQMAFAFGLERVEGKQSVMGLRSGTKYVIDAKGIAQGNEGFIIIECRRYTSSKQKQEQIGGLAYRILDTKASGGIIVSPLGLQEGAAKIANAENIQSVQLDENSTHTDYILKFLNQVFLGVSDRIMISESVLVIKRDAATG